jgi:hypothetical protein
MDVFLRSTIISSDAAGGWVLWKKRGNKAGIILDSGL